MKLKRIESREEDLREGMAKLKEGGKNGGENGIKGKRRRKPK